MPRPKFGSLDPDPDLTRLTPEEASALLYIAGAPQIQLQMPATYDRLRNRLKSSFARQVGDVIVLSASGQVPEVGPDNEAVVRTASAILGRPLVQATVPLRLRDAETFTVNTGPATVEGMSVGDDLVPIVPERKSSKRLGKRLVQGKGKTSRLAQLNSRSIKKRSGRDPSSGDP